MRVQFPPNLVSSEKRICLTRIRWENGRVGVLGGGYSSKLSISLCFVWQDMWIGAYWKGPAFDQATERFTLYIGLIPCLPIRIKLNRSYGGIYP